MYVRSPHGVNEIALSKVNGRGIISGHGAGRDCMSGAGLSIEVYACAGLVRDLVVCSSVEVLSSRSPPPATFAWLAPFGSPV